ncbi:MAG TPA: 4-hydroxy-tetrahydrodipicolinate reductase [Rhodospirillales bacterium]|nr:4-hydroxy-tetrahydrodipicolinate reductase [Rhodospirillales bacterium]
MRIGITGCAGRMGRMLLHAVLHSPGAELAGGIERPDHPALCGDLGILAGTEPLGLTAGGDAAALFAAADVVIDFSAPAAVLVHAPLAAAHSTALVVGTTGLADAHRAALAAAAASVPVVVAANMSVGVNLLLGLTRRVAEILGPEYDIEIVEMHHRHKVDAPSGTALALGEAAAAGRGVPLAEAAVRVRDGHTGPRPAGAIGFATLRGGDVVGEHTVLFAADGERLELTHKATSRTVFASGAVRAALWCDGRPPGLYSMRDVLGLA